MQQATSKRLFQYWDRVRGRRRAPRRFEIEPSQIADLLPETFIGEMRKQNRFQFRLAGTRICHHLGNELRGKDIAGLWRGHDAEAVENVIHCVSEDAAAGIIQFHAASESSVAAQFEMLLLPLVHSSEEITRLLGSITPTRPAQFIGYAPLVNFEVLDVKIMWPDFCPDFMLVEGLRHEPEAIIPNNGRLVKADRRTFRVYDGGRKD